MRIAMLGLLEVLAEDGAPVQITGARLRALLIRLALDPGRVVPTARLIDGVWGVEPPAEATNALQALVFRLRRALPEPVVESTPAGYRLAVPPDTVDVRRFETLTAQGRVALRDDPTRAAATLREALDLWRGPALADVSGAEFARATLVRLAELRLAALGDRIEAELPDADPAELEQLVAEHPLHERFAGLLMRALHAAGRSGDALAVYARTRAALADELGADPSAELAELHLSVLRGGERHDGPRTNLRAALTSFVGRDTDLARVTALVGRSRLVTLTGPGGSGKTRLATEVGRALLAELPGVWLVELAPVGDGADLPQAVQSALGLRRYSLVGNPNLGAQPEPTDPVDWLASALSTRRLLLVLDNCEHLIGPAAAAVDRLLGACPQLRILATSREPLGITGETLWPVDPLPLPPVGATCDEVLTYPAMRLLADRAGAVRPDFTVDNGTAADMVGICRALDGMPLAIELAAARLRTMSTTQLAARLDDRFRLLTGGSRLALPRHQTLRAVVDWSWDLLDDAERAVLRRLAVFAGGATLAAAERVCAGEGVPAERVLDLLSALVDKSLVVLGGERYLLLETIKAYGLDRLAEAGEADAIRRAHVAYFTELAELAEPRLREAEQLEWLHRFAADHDNLQAAVRSAIAAGETDSALRLVGNLGWYWWLGGRKADGAELAAEALAMPAGASTRARALALGMAALLTLDGLRDERRAKVWFDETLKLLPHVELDHPLLRLLGPIEVLLESYGHPTQRLRQLVDGVLEEAEDPWVRATARTILAHAELNAGRLSESSEVEFRAALADFRQIGERWGMSMVLCALAELVAWRGDLAGAAELYEEAVALFAQLVANEDLVRYRLRLAQLYHLLGRAEDSALMTVEAERDAERSGLPEALAAVAHARGEAARLRGDLATARAELLRAEKIVMDLNVTVVPQFCGMIAASLGYLAAAEGDLAAAEKRHSAGLEWALRSNDAPVIAHMLIGVADVALHRGDPVRAAELLGASAGIRGMRDLSIPDAVRVEEATRTALGEQEFAEAVARGRTATIGGVRELTGTRACLTDLGRAAMDPSDTP